MNRRQRGDRVFLTLWTEGAPFLTKRLSGPGGKIDKVLNLYHLILH